MIPTCGITFVQTKRLINTIPAMTMIMRTDGPKRQWGNTDWIKKSELLSVLMLMERLVKSNPVKKGAKCAPKGQGRG